MEWEGGESCEEEEEDMRSPGRVKRGGGVGRGIKKYFFVVYDCGYLCVYLCGARKPGTGGVGSRYNPDILVDLLSTET